MTRIISTHDSTLQVTSDTGNCTCVASNGLDSDSKSAEVKVMGESSLHCLCLFNCEWESACTLKCDKQWPRTRGNDSVGIDCHSFPCHYIIPEVQLASKDSLC